MKDQIIINRTVYYHKECLEDFAGNSRQPGFWADLWVAEDGQKLVTFGGDWIHYTETFVPDFVTGELAAEAEAALRADEGMTWVKGFGSKLNVREVEGTVR